MTSSPEEFKRRTKEFALAVVQVVERLPNRRSADVIGRQLLRAATSVGANYRAACRARSGAEFRAKLGIVEEEADECIYWLELLAESGLCKPDFTANVTNEAQQILAMIVASIRTARNGQATKRAK